MRRSLFLMATCFVPLLMVSSAVAQSEAPGGPAAGRGAGRGEGSGPGTPLFFKEEWKAPPKGAEAAVDPATAVANPNLELKLYGPGAKQMQFLGTEGSAVNPVHFWTGLCVEVCGAALRDKDNYADLTGLAKIRWITKVSGFHKVHPMIKLADGTWLVGDQADGSVTDWNENEFSIKDVRWLKLNIAKMVTTGNFVKDPDLSKVDEIGFTDLMPGSGHGPGGWSDVAMIEVFAKAVKR